MTDSHLFLDLEVAPPLDLGRRDGINRRMVIIKSGTVSGAHQGHVLPGGADWQEVGPDGGIEVDARYVLALAEGLVEVRSRGLRHGPPEVLARLAAGEPVPAEAYYFRTAIRFWTAAPGLLHLNALLATARGERLADRVRLSVELVP